MNTRTSFGLPALCFLLAATTSLFFVPNTLAGGRPRVLSAASRAPSELSLTFMDGAVLDAGPLAARGSRRPATTTRVVTMRIGPLSQESQGTAMVRAFLETPDPRCIVRVDGVILTVAPRVIRRHAPVGTPFSHRIEIEVPLSAREGSLHASIAWEITTE